METSKVFTITVVAINLLIKKSKIGGIAWPNDPID